MKDVPKGFPMGFKFNVEDNIDIDKLLEISKTYHGDKYVIGRDDNYCDKQHYHIHFFCVKETSEGAMKTFRSNTIKKTFPNIGKSFRFYTGKDLPSADPNMWLGYAIKENLIKVSGLEITDDIVVTAKSQLQIKQMKKVKSEEIKVKDKEKKEFKDKMFEYVNKEVPYYAVGDLLDKYDRPTEIAYKLLIVKYLKEQEKYGSMRRCFIDQYYLEYCCRYLEYTEKDILNMISMR